MAHRPEDTTAPPRPLPVVHARWIDDVQFVKGIGPHRAEVLRAEGIRTVADLILRLPRRYLDRSAFKSIGALEVGEKATVIGTVVAAGTIKTGRERWRRRFEAILTDGTGNLTMTWFRGINWVEGWIKKDVALIAHGKVTFYQENQMVHPELERLESEDRSDLLHAGRLIPVYPAGEAWRAAHLDSRGMRRVVMPLLDAFRDGVNDYLPAGVRDRFGWPGLRDSLQQAHYPDTEETAEIARRRLAFDELFFFGMMLARRRGRLRKRTAGHGIRVQGEWPRKLIAALPFTLTAAQERVIAEIAADMRSPARMRRLLQGDVGSGKTVVAAASMALAAEDGGQAVLMAPTEILAEQHARSLATLFRPLDFTPVLMTGSLGASERQQVNSAAADGAPILVGTHALFSEHVRFKDLRLAVIDEQHRFGVAQRESLIAKGLHPDFLNMTATPIPRTLAMTIYGDLDSSIIDEMPPRKGTTKTVWRTEDRRTKVYDYLHDLTGGDSVAYVIYPLVEESENVDCKAAVDGHDNLVARFPDRRIGLIHGRLSPEERHATMQRFFGRELDILVSTTVVEVGVDAPHARMMLIENAERFGLSQLHQLRGRVGRGEGESVCVLMIGGQPTDVAKERIETMCRTSDGFEIAEADLKLRGPGEVLGTRQHGLPTFKIARLVEDNDLIESARDAAFQLITEDPHLREPEHQLLREEFKRRYADRAKWATV